jgi:hypothetical protein
MTFGLGGYMATAAGYDPQIVECAGLDEFTAWKMKASLVGFQCAGLLLAIITCGSTRSPANVPTKRSVNCAPWTI